MIHITQQLLNAVTAEAEKSTRLRKNYNFHKELSDSLQRLLNAMEPGTYVQPHKHENPDKREVFIILSGRVLVVEFNDQGQIIDHVILDRDKGNYGVEIAHGQWHSLISLERGTIVYEIKDGPYRKIDDKNFADWAPAEGDPHADAFNQNILNQLNIPASEP